MTKYDQMTSHQDLAAPLRWPMQAMKGAASRVALAEGWKMSFH